LSVARISGSTIKRKYERKEVEKITSSNQASHVLLKSSLFFVLKVIVITAQVFLDLINHGVINFERIFLYLFLNSYLISLLWPC